MHPLYMLPIERCLPFLDPVIGTTRRCLERNGYINKPAEENPEEQKGLAQADALKEKDLELQTEEEALGKHEFDFHLDDDEDAMTRLGYGVVSYFGLIYTFMLIFLIITLVNIPVMYFNSSWHAFEQQRQLSWTAQYTVGNLGASEARCIQVKMISDSISVSCNTGSITAVTQMGAYAKDSEADQRGLCTAEGVSVNTGNDCDALSKKDHPFFSDKLQSCVG